MLRRWSLLVMAMLVFLGLTGCGMAQGSSKPEAAEGKKIAMVTPNAEQKGAGIPIKIQAGDKVWYGTLEDNATTKALVKQFPLTVKMENLYDREMCYRMGEGALPVTATRDDNYEVGDIIYWPPRGSLVILYKQNGERFTRQFLGRVTGDLSAFAKGEDMTLTWDIAK